MKKRLALLLAAVLTLSMVMAGCGSKEETSEEKKEGDEFVVGFDQDFPPMGFVGDDGEYTGFDLELAEEVCNRLGWKFRPEPIAWDSKDALIEQGDIDCIWNGFTINGREEDYTWSEPYLNNKQVFVVREDSGIESIDDLAGKKIGVQETTTGDIYASDDFGEDNVIRYANGAVAVEALKAGKVDCVIIDNEPAKAYVAANEGLKILETSYADEDYAIAVSKDNPELKDAIDAALKELIADGSLQKIVDKYIPA